MYLKIELYFGTDFDETDCSKRRTTQVVMGHTHTLCQSSLGKRGELRLEVFKLECV